MATELLANEWQDLIGYRVLLTANPDVPHHDWWGTLKGEDWKENENTRPDILEFTVNAISPSQEYVNLGSFGGRWFRLDEYLFIETLGKAFKMKSIFGQQSDTPESTP